jgi:oxygen-dependent protoporphyrinogen oxidase
MSHYAIIGAGLTGLTAAYYLQKNGHQVTVFDKQATPGGVICTHREKGFVFESGPNTGVISHPEVTELFNELSANCTIDIANPAAKSRWIWKGQQWEELPSNPLSFIRTPLFTAKDKLKLFREPWQPKGTNPDETLDQMVIRRLGKSFLDYAVNPFIAGIYTGDPSYLVTRYALPKLYNLEQKYGSFIKGSIKKKKEVTDPRMKLATREVFSVKGGLDNLTKALADNIGRHNLQLGCDDVQIQFKGNHQFDIEGTQNGAPFKLSFTDVITTCGAYALPSLLPFIDAGQLQPITELIYAKVVQVILGFNQWLGMPINAFGGLVPSCEKREILGILFPSSFLESRAPLGGALLSVFMGGMRHPEMFNLSDDELLKIVERETTQMMKLPSFNPDMVKVFRYQHAIPQYGASTGARLEAVTALEQQYPGLVLAGNLRDGIGMGDRIKQGQELASR